MLHLPHFLSLTYPLKLNPVSILIWYLFHQIHKILYVAWQKDFWISGYLFCRRIIVSGSFGAIPCGANTCLASCIWPFLFHIPWARFCGSWLLSELWHLSLASVVSLFQVRLVLQAAGPLSGSLPSSFLCVSQQLLLCRPFRRMAVMYICPLVTSHFSLL